MEPSGFDWGWDAFVALGTLALALATAWLGWGTRRMAQATTADVRAQWRPVVAPGEDAEVMYTENDKRVTLTIRNVGRGAAYYVDAGLDVDDGVHPASMRVAGTTLPRNFAVFPAGEEMDLDFEYFDQRPIKAVLIVDYTDLNGRPYATRITIDAFPLWGNQGQEIDKIVRMDRVETFDKQELIPWKPPTTIRGRVEWWRAARRQRKENKGKEWIKLPPEPPES